MEKESALGFVLMIAVLILLAYYLSQYQTGTSAPVVQVQGTDGSGTGSVVLSAAEVARHNGAQSCWLLIEGKVYDATNYMNVHPGGRDRILPFCGADATEPFLTQGGKGSHSSLATEQLGTLYLGDLNSTVGNQTLNTVGQRIPTGSSDEEED